MGISLELLAEPVALLVEDVDERLQIVTTVVDVEPLVTEVAGAVAERASDDVVGIKDLLHFLCRHARLVVLGRGEEAPVVLQADIL